jgi:RNA 2',3'-cyclic 3'-phosphodiesterase
MVEGLGRIFAAVALPTEVRLALADRLAQFDLPGKIAPPENWHITLRFLGSVDIVTAERFTGSLSGAELGDPFRVGLGGLGGFPNSRRATVLWLGLSDGLAGLTRLAVIAEEAAQAAGLDPVERPFRPHLTLGRIRPPADIRALVESVEPMSLAWVCNSIVVYRSHLGGHNARYEPLEKLGLGR